MTLKNKVAIVTGGGTGLGAAITKRLRSEGALVAIMGRRQTPLDELANSCGALPIAADMSNTEQVKGAISKVIADYGKIDIVIANAGGHGFANAIDTDDLAWQQSLNANLTTAFITARETMPFLIKQKGVMVIISSLAGLFAGPNVTGYTVGKHALLGLTKSLARDYGRYGVRVNSISPGWVRTPMADAEMNEFIARLDANPPKNIEEAYLRVTQNVPLQRAAAPYEIAAIVNFLVSTESSYITGTNIIADGGAHIVDLPTIAFDQ